MIDIFSFSMGALTVSVFLLMVIFFSLRKPIETGIQGSLPKVPEGSPPKPPEGIQSGLSKAKGMQYLILPPGFKFEAVGDNGGRIVPVDSIDYE